MIRCIEIASLLLMSLSCLLAQYTTASLNGNVLDASGAPIPAARVSVRNTATGFVQRLSRATTARFCSRDFLLATMSSRLTKKASRRISKLELRLR